MDKVFSGKINLLKAGAIMLVVSGHLEFSIFGMFPPYSFQLALFFFISGMLFKEKYLDDVKTYLKRRVKTLVIPYFIYNFVYMIITLIIFKLTNVLWAKPITLKNFFVTAFLNGHQFDLSCPLWFVTQLFMTLVVFLFLMKVFRNFNKYITLIFFLILSWVTIPLSNSISLTSINLVLLRTSFSLFFVYLGFFYFKYIKDNHNIFTVKWLGIILCLQSILWLFNRDFDPIHGIGLSYI